MGGHRSPRVVGLMHVYNLCSMLTYIFCAQASQHISYKTLKVYLSGIRLAHIERGLPDPTDSPSLHLVCRGIRRQQGDSKRTRLPITINLLRLLKQHLRSCTSYSLIEQRMLWAMFTVAFYGFFRASELLSNLTWSDVVLSSTQMTITLYQSKTDPFRRGQCVHIFASGSSTCPIRAMNCYRTLVGSPNTDDPVFKAGQFNPLTQNKVNKVLRHLLQQSGINDGNYASHSFRIGAATTAAAAGIPGSLIKVLGRWNSDAYLTYIQCPDTVLSAVPRILSGADATHQPSWDPDLSWPYLAVQHSVLRHVITINRTLIDTHYIIMWYFQWSLSRELLRMYHNQLLCNYSITILHAWSNNNTFNDRCIWVTEEFGEKLGAVTACLILICVWDDFFATKIWVI